MTGLAPWETLQSAINGPIFLGSCTLCIQFATPSDPATTERRLTLLHTTNTDKRPKIVFTPTNSFLVERSKPTPLPIHAMRSCHPQRKTPQRLACVHQLLLICLRALPWFPSSHGRPAPCLLKYNDPEQGIWNSTEDSVAPFRVRLGRSGGFWSPIGVYWKPSRGPFMNHTSGYCHNAQDSTSRGPLRVA